MSAKHNTIASAYATRDTTILGDKRIQLLNFEKKDVVGIEIRDNFEGAVPSGTTVIIRIHV